MKKHIIFDFDDTLSSSYNLNQQIFYETLLSFSDNIDEAYVRNYHKTAVGLSMYELFDHIVKRYGLNKPTKELVEENERLNKARSDETSMLEGVEELLIHFKKHGKVLSICSNRDKTSLELILAKHNLIKYFDDVISCADVGHQKPDPFCLTNLLKKYPHISSEETIYFGDSKTDEEFATNANIDCLVVDQYLNRKKFYALLLGIFSV